MALAPPILSALDPTEEGEGSIDPFATQAGYERLADRIYPSMTVRMARPRFLTAIAVAGLVCQPFRDEMAADGVTPPYLVLEWYVVEGHVLRRSDAPDLDWNRFPGSMKVERTLGSGRPVSAASYLKTPKVFGYTGVHKRLAVGLEIVDEDVDLDEGGFALLKLWEEEQDLDGFVSGDSGAGAAFREDLRKAVRRGLESARTRYSNSRLIADRIVQHLRFDRPGTKEAKWLFGRLVSTDFSARDHEALGVRRELIERLIQRGHTLESQQEQAFLRSVAQDCSPALRERLHAIDVYESICRPLEDSLRLILFLSAVRGPAPIGAKEFGAHELADPLASRLTKAVARARVNEPLLNWEPEVLNHISRYEDVRTGQDLFEAVVRHHEEAQSGKPPDGKRPWFARADAGKVEARPQYRFNNPPEGSDAYVHIYRTSTVARFLRDLGRIAA